MLVARIAVSARRRFVSPPSSRCSAEPACTVMVAMLWATVFTRGSGKARIRSASRAARAETEEAGGTLGQ